MNQNSISLTYDGFALWPILWALVFFPVSIALILMNGRLEINGQRLALHYKGSTFWLLFWVIVCLPVALVLMLVKGFSFEYPT